MTQLRDIPLPRPPQPPQAFSFPFLATLAPVVASLGMWAITRSPFALMFAALGPLVALGSLLDARVQGRRRLGRELERYAVELAAVALRIEQEHSRLRELLRHRLRACAALLPAPLHDAERWRYEGGEVQVVLGSGEQASGLRVTGDAAVAVPAPRQRRRRSTRGRGRSLEDHSREAEALREQAAVLAAAPIAVDARLGIGVCGARVPALAVARAVVVQLADRLSPEAFEFGGAIEAWHHVLPHSASPGGDTLGTRLDIHARHGGERLHIPVVVVEHAEDLPRECRVGVEVVGGEIRMLRHPHLGQLGVDGLPRVPSRFRADFVSALEAHRFATVLGEAAEREGLVRSGGAVPSQVGLDEVWHSAGESGGLSAAFAAGASGPLAIDLVADGPHAVVGGTTGSGKSELLIAWVLALARERSPQELSFLLVDFKGGSSFGSVEHLPHCVGVLTDLDTVSAARALDSLRAEVRHRERVLAAAGVRAIEELGPGRLARLVVMVDEFAAMMSDFPELHSLFGDLAARGRSLGVHLVLCTQRPGGVVRDSILANCSLRLSLRVNNAQDSRAVLGADAAAELPRDPVGRCFVSVAGATPELVQVALAAPEHVAVVEQRWRDTPRPRRPWLAPLPPRIPWGSVATMAGHPSGPLSLPLGLTDLPEEQRQPLAEWRPREQGNLLVVGGRGAGKTGALDALAAGARLRGVEVLPLGRDIESAWDALASTVRGDAADGGTLVLLDDLDALIARLPESHSLAFLDHLTALLREGPGRGWVTAASVQRLTPAIQSSASLFDARLLLRLSSRQDHVLAGGEGAHHDLSAPPGRGRWRGKEVQLAFAETQAEWAAHGSATATPVHLAAPLLAGIVSTRIRAVLPALERAGRTPCAPQDAASLWASGVDVVAIGDPHAWQAAWNAFPAARARGEVVFDGCSVAQFRLISGVATLPPPLAASSEASWVLGSDDTVHRGQLAVQTSTPRLVDKLND